MIPALLDTDILSEIFKQRDDSVLRTARAYLDEQGRFAFSVLTRYEILRGLRSKGATRQELAFDALCRFSQVLPVTDSIAVRAAIYADLRLRRWCRDLPLPQATPHTLSASPDYK